MYYVIQRSAALNDTQYEQEELLYILICSDITPDADRLESMLREIASANDISVVIDVFSDIDSICFMIEDIYPKVDLVYIDMDYPDNGGLKIANRLRMNGYIGDIVFISDSDRYALSGYDFGILNYVIKKDTPADKFEHVFLSSFSRKKARDRDTLLLSCAGETICVPVEDIRYFEISARVVTVHYRDGIRERTFEFYSSMKKLETQLSSRGFIRIHKSFLVNAGYISEITLKQVFLYNGASVPIGKKYMEKLNLEKNGNV